MSEVSGVATSDLERVSAELRARDRFLLTAHEGPDGDALGSLRRFKDNVQEVEEGQECGVVLEGYADVKEEDVLEFFQTKQVEQTLE